jgi:hypothetical protein
MSNQSDPKKTAIIGVIIGAIITGIFGLVTPIISDEIRERSATPTPQLISNKDCITVGRWEPFSFIHDQAYSTSQLTYQTAVPQTECWYLYNWGISAQNGELHFSGRLTKNTDFYGLSTTISTNSNVQLSIQFQPIDTGDWFVVGISSSPIFTPDDKASGLSPISDGVFVKVWGGYESPQSIFLESFNKGEKKPLFSNQLKVDTIHLRFTIHNAQLTVYLNDNQLNATPVNVVYDSLYLILGYESSFIGGGTNIRVFDLK